MTKPTLASLQAELDTARARILELEQRPASVRVDIDGLTDLDQAPRIVHAQTVVVEITSPDETEHWTITATHATWIRRTR